MADQAFYLIIVFICAGAIFYMVAFVYLGLLPWWLVVAPCAILFCIACRHGLRWAENVVDSWRK